MNNFHLYEEIGHGKFCTVYKGRKRYTIRYVAVKSIEKSRRDKVMVEVRVLSQLHHPNVVSFINWYETRNHLWIIYEYCTGGDLVHLLKQDGRLPEEQARYFGQGICHGLLHVHARGIIYSDLKPGNVLFNEHGELKLSGFGHAQSLDELARMLEDNTPVPRRGTPAYMAPELFQDGGVHSFASDLWSLGCVLYELSVGRPPFAATSFQQVQERVVREPVPPSQYLSEHHRSLVTSLLRKPPLDRSGWPALRAHAFWQGETPGDEADIEALPAQPHVGELQRIWQRVCGADVAPVATDVLSSDGGGAASGGSASTSFSPPPRAPSAAPDAKVAEATEVCESDGRVDEGLPVDEESAPDAMPSVEAAVAAARAPSAAAPHRLDDGAGGGRGARGAGALPAVGQATSPHDGASGVDATGRGARSLEALLGASAFSRARELLMGAGVEVGVRPISRNPQIEELEPLEPVPEADLPFAPLRLDEAASRQPAEWDAFLSKVYRCIAGGPLEQRCAVLSYLERACAEPGRGPMQVADLIANSSLLRLFLRALRAPTPPTPPPPTAAVPVGGVVAAAAASAVPLALHARLLSLIGQLLRHVTFLEPSLAASGDLGIFEALLDSLVGQQDVGLRRRAMAAIGELLFYIAAQPPATSGDAEGWSVPDALLDTIVETIVRTDADEVVQHYAAKTVENIATQQPAVALRWFFSQELLRGLAGHVHRSSSLPFRITCLAACAHLFRAMAASDLASSGRGGTGSDPGVAGYPQLPELVGAGLVDLAPHGVPHALQLAAALLLSAADAASVAKALLPSTMDQLMAVLSQPRLSVTLRARAALLSSLLFVADDSPEARLMRLALDRSFVPHVDRLGREKDRFVAQCVAAAAGAVDAVALALLRGLVSGLRQSATVQVGGAASPGASSGAGFMMQVVAILLHLVTSTVLCTSVLSADTLPLLGAALELLAKCGGEEQLPGEARVGSDMSDLSGTMTMLQLQALMLMFMEALGAQALLMEHATQALDCLLPALATFLPSPRPDVRLLALKSFSGMCITFLNDSHVFDPMAEPISDTTRRLEALLCARVLPELPTLLADEPPAPSCAFRLLLTLLSRGSAAAGSSVRTLGLATHLLGALSREQALTLHSALLVHCLLQSQEVQVRDLERAGVFAAVHSALEEAAEPAQLDFAMLDAALSVAEEAYAQQQDKADGPERTLRPVQALLDDLGPLVEAMPVLAGLCLPLAQAKLAPLLDRTASCCQRLASLLGRRSATTDAGRDSAGYLPLASVVAILETLSEVSNWRHRSGSDTAEDLFAPRSLQLRLLSVLSWVVVIDSTVEVRAEVAVGIEHLLQERVLGDDAAVLADARSLMAAAVGEHLG